MNPSLRWPALVVTLAAALLGGCVSADGTKALKREDPKISAAKANVQLGTAYLKQGNYPVAKEKLERSLKQNPKDPDVHTSLGWLYDRTGEFKLADRHFREALRLAPEKPDLINNYAIHLCKTDRVDEAVERFTTVAASKYYGTPEVALTNAGVCLRNVKRFDEAEQKFVGAIKARPNFSEPTVQLAGMYLERDRAPDARRIVDTYINAFKPNADVLLSAVRVARVQKDKVGEEKFSRVLRLEFADSPQERALKRN